MLVLAAGGIITACGSDGKSAKDTLPPIVTTTTTTTTVAPTTTIPSSYVIQPGDTLQKIAQMFGISRSFLAAYNGITNPNKIDAGETLKIPQPGETTIPQTTLPPTTIA